MLAGRDTVRQHSNADEFELVQQVAYQCAVDSPTNYPQNEILDFRVRGLTKALSYIMTRGN